MITVVGSLNLDFFIETPRLPRPGETVLGRRFRRAPGGKGANQACAAARLRARNDPTHFLGCVGDDDFGRLLSENLGHFGVRTEGLLIRPHTASGVAFIAVDDVGANQIVVASGANATLTTHDVERHRELLEKSRIVIAQLEVPVPAVEAALRLARSAGAWLNCRQVCTHLAPFPVPAVDTVGAGDAFVGAFAVALSEGQHPHAAAAFASATAALAVTQPGAQDSLPTRSAVDDLLATAAASSAPLPS